MHFTIDPMLLGSSVTDSSLRFTIRPPVTLVPADSGMVHRLHDDAVRAAGSGDSLAVATVLLFATPAGGALCRVGRFLAPPRGRLDPGWVDLCRAALQRQVSPALVASDLYRVGRTTVVAQFLARNESTVLFRLLCQGPGPVPFLVDYLVPVGDYPGLARAIESSIGSLETF
jgi:hypothetical protein